MDRIGCPLLVTLFSVFFPTIAWAESPRVMVELAFVTRIQQPNDPSPLKEEFEQLLPDSELAKEGLVPFLDDWLRGKNRDLLEVDLMQLKIPLGEEVEFATRHLLPAEFEDPNTMFEAAGVPMRPDMGLVHGGLSAVVRAQKKPNEKVHIKFRVMKKMPAAMELSEDEDRSGERPLPILRTQWTDTELDLELRQASVLGGLLQKTSKDGEDITRELVILVHVHLAEPAPFPAD